MTTHLICDDPFFDLCCAVRDGSTVEPDERITRTRSDGSRYVELKDAVAKQKADGRWEQIKSVQLSEPEGELARLERELQRLREEISNLFMLWTNGVISTATFTTNLKAELEQTKCSA